MSKKSAKPKSGISAMLASQLKAIERLIERRDEANAVRRLRALIKAHPDQSAARRLLVEALERSEGSRAAAVAAFDWAERRPKSFPAQQLLYQYAVQLGHILLAERTAERLRALGAETPAFPLDPAIRHDLLRQPDGSTASVEQVVLFDIGKLHLDGHDFEGVLRWLEGTDLTPAKNNRAMALFHLGRIEDALTVFLALRDQDPDNLFASGWAIRLNLYLGDEARARDLATTLAGATPRRLEDALAQLDALLLLREDAAARDAYRRAAGCEWFGLGGRHERAILGHLAACAASRTGELDEARLLWNDALKLMPELQSALEGRALLEGRSEAAAYPPVFSQGQALPITWLNRMREPGNDPHAHIGQATASNAFLDALYLGGDSFVRQMVALLFKYRAAREDPDAAERLKRFARLPIGTREMRLGFIRDLQDQGLLPGDEPLDLWDRDGVTQVKMIRTEIRREPEDSGLPKDLDLLLERSIRSFNARDYAGSEILLNRILEHVPGHRVALGNLAAIRSVQGRHEESRELLRDLVGLHPDYIFPRCNLAVMLIQDGELEEADGLLRGLYERPSLHVQEVFVLYGALAMLSRARGDTAGADALLASLEPLIEDEDDRRRMALAKRLQGRVRVGAKGAG